MIDTHAHVFADQFDENRDAMLARARTAGVEAIYMPNINGDSIAAMMRLAAQDPGFLKPMLGLHPCYVGEDWSENINQIEDKLQASKVVGIGETGLDYYWDTTYAKQQKKSLERHVEWALEWDLPIILHSRSAIDDTIEVMQAAGPNISGIFHCFTGTYSQARRILDLGFKLGIGGIVTFKNAGLDKVVEKLPLEGLVLETDAPYLAPHPHRSKKNEPAYLGLIAEKIAAIHQIEVEEVVRMTTASAREVFADEGMVASKEGA
jgi:TatD DNase family protein